jgi:hypothetical protein
MNELIERLEAEQDTLKRHAPKVWVDVDRQSGLKLLTDCKEALEQKDKRIAELEADKAELLMGFSEACVMLGIIAVKAQQEDYTYLNEMKAKLKIGFTPSGEPTIDSPLLAKHQQPAKETQQ